MAIDSAVRSRRAILLGALGATVASVAAAVGRANPASAADDDPVLVGHGHSATSSTGINATGAQGFYGNSDSSVGVYGSSQSKVGVHGESFAPDHPGILGRSYFGSTGVQGYSGANGAPPPQANTGVYGRADQASGTGVHGETTDTSAETYGVHGLVAAAKGRGVFGWAINQTAGGTGVWGQSSSGSGAGVRGYAWDGDAASGKFGTGVLGSSGSHAYPPKPRANIGVMGVADPANGTGVYGTSANGRGAQFVGGLAQIRLLPSAAAIHPATGLPGDLFLDKSHRLWFCKGGPTWTQIA